MNTPTHSLQVVRQLKHERTRVFSALTDPAKMAQWFFGMPGGSAKVANDLRIGGKYTVEMAGSSCGVQQGTYLEIVPPERLVFTWTMSKDGSLTKVTVELFEEEEGTKLVLTHELPEQHVAGHREGWNICFDHLALFLAGRPATAAGAVKV
jgi:uncharacterized protein YndB with AHSA1/START domain